MVSQHDEEQRLLVDQQRSSSDLFENDRGSTYNTFTNDVSKKLGQHESDKPDEEDEDPGYTWRTIMMIMSTWIGVFLSSADFSIMATLTGPISESFSAFNLLTWFVNAYTISSALIQPLSGKLSDIYGRRNCLLWANFAFLLGNLLCGLATESWHFVLGRAIAGLGGGCLHSIPTFLASDVIPLRARGFWQGVSNVAFALGFSLGGTIGGVVSDTIGWKWAFLSQPIAIVVSMILVIWLVPNITADKADRPSLRQLDFLGSITLSLAIISLMFGAVSGGNTLPWSSPFVYGSLIISPIILAIFVYVEDRVAKFPMIPVRLLANRSILGACLACLFGCTANTAVYYYLPIALEVHGLSPAQAGLRLIPSAVGAFIGSMTVGAVMNKTGKYYWATVISMLGLVCGSLTMLLTLQHITGWIPIVMLFINGLGFGSMLVTTLLALVSATEHKQQAVITSASYGFRTIGNTLGPTIAGALFQNVLDQQLWLKLGKEENAATLIPAIRKRDIKLDSLPASWRLDVLSSYDISFHAVFVFIVATYLLAALSASVIREYRLHKTINRR